MKLETAYQLANELMVQHNLSIAGWKFEFDNAKRRFGCCKYRTKRITLSASLTKLNSEDKVKNTILHEIAHALVGYSHGHDWVWQRKAIEIGCDGQRCYSDDTETPPSKYHAICVGCGKEHKRHKAPNIRKSASCGNCSGGRYNPTFKLNWVSNVTNQLSIS